LTQKKKENVGNFKNNGRTYQPKGNPIKVFDHDFPLKELGKVTPYGVYNIFKETLINTLGAPPRTLLKGLGPLRIPFNQRFLKNQGFVSVSISSDTAVFAVSSV
jgi:hypothetical protein